MHCWESDCICMFIRARRSSGRLKLVLWWDLEIYAQLNIQSFLHRASIRFQIHKGKALPVLAAVGGSGAPNKCCARPAPTAASHLGSPLHSVCGPSRLNARLTAPWSCPSSCALPVMLEATTGHLLQQLQLIQLLTMRLNCSCMIKFGRLMEDVLRAETSCRKFMHCLEVQYA